MANLRINYQSVMNRAQEMENQITRLSREINSMESLRIQSKSCWDGPASEVFRGKLDQLIENTRATQRRMKNVVEDIRTKKVQGSLRCRNASLFLRLRLSA